MIRVGRFCLRTHGPRRRGHRKNARGDAISVCANAHGVTRRPAIPRAGRAAHAWPAAGARARGAGRSTHGGAVALDPDAAVRTHVLDAAGPMVAGGRTRGEAAAHERGDGWARLAVAIRRRRLRSRGRCPSCTSGLLQHVGDGLAGEARRARIWGISVAERQATTIERTAQVARGPADEARAAFVLAVSVDVTLLTCERAVAGVDAFGRNAGDVADLSLRAADIGQWAALGAGLTVG